MTENTLRVLIIDDEPAIRKLLKISMQAYGYELGEAATGQDGLLMAASFRPDIILVDLGLPDMDGKAVVKALREWSETPIIVLTAREQEQEKIAALDVGADDYVTKPFNPVTLGAKVKALIRRSRNGLPGADSLITAGPFTYNTSTLRFYKNGVEIPLSAKENAMMKLFIDNVNRIFSKDMLYDLLWGEAIIDENAIMVYVNRLRAKIEEDPAHPAYIQTVRGLGYRFVV